MEPTVSVVMCVRNVSGFIKGCITSLLDQTLNNFEIIVIDDMSSDNTSNIIRAFDDERIRYLRNIEWLGIPKSRNRGLQHAKGKYVFFTDGDCMVSKNWIEEGLRFFTHYRCIGVEGKTYYVSEKYRPTHSDAIIENHKGGQFMTCNVAYTKSILEDIGGFDERYTYLDDRDLALRAIKHGRICFNPQMIVYHQKVVLGPSQFVRTGKRIRDRVLLYKKFRDRSSLIWRIAYPLDLIAVIFPPLILGSFLISRYKTKEDLILLPFTYVRLVYERLSLWHMCAKERVFLI